MVMTAAWMHSFGNPGTIKGDHWMLGIDIDPDILFGMQTIPKITMSRRGVHSQNEQNVTKFCTRAVEKCNQENLAEHLQILLQTHHMMAAQYAELKAIDKCLTKILLQADWACLPPNPAPWLPALNQAYFHHWLWNVALLVQQNKRDMKDIITALWAHLTPSPTDELELT